MKEVKEFLNNYISELVKKYQSELDLRGYPAEEIIADCKKNFDDSIWVITEVLTSIYRKYHNQKVSDELNTEINKFFEYNKFYELNNVDDFEIFQIEDKFIKWVQQYKTRPETLQFVEKKEKLIPQIIFE